jgi:hypothetical protein
VHRVTDRLPSSDVSRAPRLTLVLVALPGDPDTSDAWALRDAGVHAVHFSTGPHDDYHSPADTPDKVSRPQALRVARFLRALVERTERTAR